MLEVHDQKAFDQALVENPLVLVDFYATWCGPCKKIAPKIESLSEEHEDVKFLKVNVDEADTLASRLNISSLPTFVLYKNKEEHGRVVGAHLDAVKGLVSNEK